MQSSQTRNNSAELTWSWNGKTYFLPITSADILELARAVDEEGYPSAGVAWALIQRAAWLRSHGQIVSLGKLVTQYAQPINPAWFPDAPKHIAEVTRLESLGDIAGAEKEKARALQRPGKAMRPWNMLNASTRKIIEDILSGKLKSPVPGAVHYWQSRGPDFTSNQARRPELILLDRGFGFGPRRNVFFAERSSERFGGIRVINGQNAYPGDGKLPPNTPTGPLVACAIAGYLAWKWFV